MGLTIYYTGKLKSPESIEAFLDETIDICLGMGWRFDLVHRSSIMPVKGILISPEGSEPLWLTFLPDGRMYNPAHIMCSRNPEEETVDEEKHKWAFTKTQYAGVDAHIAMIKLLRFLSQKYFDWFELKDESYYWETNDEDVCKNHFEKFDFIMDMMADALGSMDAIDDESAETLAGRIEEMLKEKGWTEGELISYGNFPYLYKINV